jgi:hypothetical protein
MRRGLQQPSPFRSFRSAPAALEVDFGKTPAPQLVTAILAACSPDDLLDEELWALPVGSRLQHLLTILALEGEPALWAQLRCANADCGEAIEVELSPGELVALAAEHAEDSVVADVGERRLNLRRPIGTDQLVWQERAFSDEAEARCSVVADLTGLDATDVDNALMERVEAALARVDPLVSLELDAVCAYCERQYTYELDLLELVLGRFREDQDELLAELHVLASHYHWTETEILVVPAGRRARYLELVELGRG